MQRRERIEPRRTSRRKPDHLRARRAKPRGSGRFGKLRGDDP